MRPIITGPTETRLYNIAHLPYGITRRNLLLQYIIANGNIHVNRRHTLQTSDPDIQILLKKKKVKLQRIPGGGKYTNISVLVKT